ncbi:MAG: indolepyruvate oxidoreductase subunit beta [Oscillospiraceae bacterium]
MNLNCLLTGVGGQGTVLASKLIARAGVARGLFARTSETIGMAQRGGSVTSHVRVGKDVKSAIIPKGTADVMIAFEPSEAVRNLAYLKPHGACIVASKPVQPVTASLGSGGYNSQEMIDFLKANVGTLLVVDGDAMTQKAGNPKTLNVILLGAALPYLGFEEGEIERAIHEALPEKIWSVNIQALEIGGQCHADE